jgi:hypothetical protein
MSTTKNAVTPVRKKYSRSNSNDDGAPGGGIGTPVI